MAREIETRSIKGTARVAGLLYLLVALFGAFGLVYVPSVLIVPGDGATTANNILASESLFRLGIVSALITQTVQILLVLTLYKLLKPVNRNHALLMVIFILLGVPIAMLNELNHIVVLLLSDANYLTVFTSDQLQALVPLFLDLHEHGIMIAHIFWGLWLLPMGYLIFKTGYIPRILGVLLIIGGFGYLIDFVTFFLFPDFDVTIAEFTFIGELLLPLWLLFRGVDVQQWENVLLNLPEHNPC
jgi:Domain of unknown function (DUF4386)